MVRLGERTMAMDAVPIQSLRTLNDDALMARVAETDDIEAFETLYARYESYARRILIAYFGYVDDIEDLVQECFIRIFTHRKRYKMKDSFRSWFYRIVMNLAHDLWRKRHRMERLQKKLQKFAGKLGVSSLSPAESIETRSDSVSIIQALISTLPPRQRQVLILRYVEEMSLKEIAAVLELNEGSIKSTLHHATKRLQKEYKKWKEKNESDRVTS